MLRIIEYTDVYKEKVIDFLIEIILNEFEMNENVEDIQNYNYNQYKNNGGNLWIAVDEYDNVKATCAIENYIEKEEAKLARLYLDKGHRGTLIASKLLEIAIEFVKELEYKRITLGTYEKLERANSFYKKNGFKEYEVRYVDDDVVKFYELNLVN